MCSGSGRRRRWSQRKACQAIRKCGVGLLVVVVSMSIIASLYNALDLQSTFVARPVLGNDAPVIVTNVSNTHHDGKDATTATTSSSSSSSSQLALFYSSPRNDRSGAFLQDMLFAHAFATAHNYTYGGCCDEKGKVAKHKDAVQQLAASLGLQDIIHFACPANITTLQNNGSVSSITVNNNNNGSSSGTVFPRKSYYTKDTMVWTRKWVKYIQGMATYDVDSKPMVVHIRRGDVTVCPDVEKRYQPNSHYLRLIRKYRPTPTTPVTIYSETNSTEDWVEFANDPYIELQLDTPIEGVVRALASAQIFIMSKSSFSLVPAMLNRNKVIYTPFWHKPLPTWTVVPMPLLRKTSDDLRKLRHSHGC